MEIWYGSKVASDINYWCSYLYIVWYQVFAGVLIVMRKILACYNRLSRKTLTNSTFYNVSTFDFNYVLILGMHVQNLDYLGLLNEVTNKQSSRLLVCLITFTFITTATTSSYLTKSVRMREQGTTTFEGAPNYRYFLYEPIPLSSGLGHKGLSDYLVIWNVRFDSDFIW